MGGGGGMSGGLFSGGMPKLRPAGMSKTVMEMVSTGSHALSLPPSGSRGAGGSSPGVPKANRIDPSGPPKGA